MSISKDQWAQLRKIKSGMSAAAPLLTDAQASIAPGLYPVLSYSGMLVKAGTRIQWEGQLKRAAVDLWDREEHDPAHAPTQWEDINYKNGVRIIPDVITSTLAFGLDELGWWHGSAAAQEGVYRSDQAGNSFPPGTQGAKWTYVGSDAAEGQGDGGETPEPPTEPEPETPTEPADEWPLWKPWDGNNASLHKVGDKVTHNGKRWVSTENNNHWEPGVYGWNAE